MWKPDLWTPARELARWHVTTQIGSRRNALLAYTALTQRRREHDDVEKFLNQVNPPSEPLLRSPGRQIPISMSAPERPRRSAAYGPR